MEAWLPVTGTEGYECGDPVVVRPLHRLPCPLCPMRFKRRWNLNMHLHTHTGERPFRCSHCSRAFADRSNMRKHMLIHTRKYRA